MLTIPRASRGYVFDRLFSIEMNDFDVERLLPSLFYLIVTGGRQRGSSSNDPKDVHRYIRELSFHPRLKGFETEPGRRLLDRWIRASTVRIGKAGQAKKEEQIEFVLPLTLLAYKTGFPAEIRRQRNVHLFLYQILADLASGVSGGRSGKDALRALFKAAYGKGVRIGDSPSYNGRYDGDTPLDIHALLCLCFLDGFQPTVASRREALARYGPALPGVARGIGRDLLRYIQVYRDRMPNLAHTRGLMVLINFELFVYTAKLVYATTALLKDGELPPAMCSKESPSPPELYVDFTRERGGPSDEISRGCVERDLEELRAFFDSAMELRTLHRFLEYQPQLKERLQSLNTPSYLKSLVGLRAEPGIEARAQAEIESIRYETNNATQGSAERADADAIFAEALRRAAGSSLSAVVKLLTLAQEKKAVEAYVQWFWSVGGLRQRFGLLAGNLRGRRNWRYAMSDDLLAALVQLAMVDDLSGRLENVTVRPRLRLGDFLGFLDRRFGLIVDRPPAFLDSAVSRAAARENFEALKRRLRQMGFFRALSDDFTAQYLNVQLVEVSA